MKTVLKERPITGAITLDEAKIHLGYDLAYTGRDDEIKSNILAATSSLDSMTGKRTITQTINIVFDSWKELKECTILQGKINNMSLSYVDADRDNHIVTDYIVVGIDSDEGLIVFNDDFDYPEIWGIESIILTVEVGEDIEDVSQEKKVIVKLMISEFMEDIDASKIISRFVINNKYWSC